MQPIGFAVIDFETTGFSPKRGDRVLEVGIVQLDLDGTFQGSFQSLINPQRDVGPTSIHGISASDVVDAPVFGDLAENILNLISGRVLVAHNFSFDARFLKSEFEIAGVDFDLEQIPSLCTMNLASLFLTVNSRSLEACCSAAGIEFSTQHAALNDASATAQLLAMYLRQDHFRQVLSNALGTKSFSSPRDPIDSDLHSSKPRSNPPNESGAKEFIPKTIQLLPDAATTDEERELLSLFDAVLADGLVEAEEQELIQEFVAAGGISEQKIRELQVQYFLDFVNTAWADGSLNRAEIIGIRYVGRMMGQTDLEVESKINAISDGSSENAPHFSRISFTLEDGAAVVLTGEMQEPREYYVQLLEAKGFKVAPNVSKKVAAVLAQDVNSLSGKARKARTMGIPVVCIEDLLPSLLDDSE